MAEIAEQIESTIVAKEKDESKTEIEDKTEEIVPEQANGHEIVDDVKEKVNECEADEKQATESTESKLAETDMEVKAPITEANSPVVQADEKANEQKKEDDQTDNKKDTPLGSTVAKHYNDIPAGSKEIRKNSRIFFLRNFNNWCKSVIITEFLEKVKRRKRLSDEINVLDLGCGKGGDLLKWEKGKVDHVILADIAETSIEHCKERYKKLEKDHKGRKYTRDHLFTTEYYAVDCTKEKLSDKYKKKDIKLDLTSCQFAFHYSFESYEQADMMLKNACENLRVGGYFIGTTLNANKVVHKLKNIEGDNFGNSVFNIKYDDNKEVFPLFGAKYMFHLEEVVDCPEFLVHIPTLEKLASKYNMVLKWKKSFHQLYEDHKRDFESLLSRMNALEKYPGEQNKPLCAPEEQYVSAKEYLHKRTNLKTVGTLSVDEWEMAGLYIAFAFEKVEPQRESRANERDDRKRRRDRSGENRSRSRDTSRHKDSRKKEGSSAKRSRKESETEEVYEIKDEIEGDDDLEGAKSEKTETETAIATQGDSKEVSEHGESSGPVPDDEGKKGEVVEENKECVEGDVPVEASEVVAETEERVETENSDATEVRADA